MTPPQINTTDSARLALDLGQLTHITSDQKLLGQVRRAFTQGDYGLALTLAERMKPSLTCDRIHAELAVLQARCYQKLGQPKAGMDQLLAANAQVITSDLSLFATYQSVLGLMNRTLAIEARTMGDLSGANMLARWAVAEFRQARELADEFQQALAWNNRLNELMTTGLIGAIEGTTASINAALLIEAVIVEAEIRRWSPPALRNDIVGLTVIADLARGIDLPSHEVARLDSGTTFCGAVAKVLGHHVVSWPAQLLNSAREITTPPAAKAKGLILGVAFLEQERYKGLRESLLRGYQVEMWDAFEHLRKFAHGFNTALMTQIMLALKRLDSFAEACAKPVFQGRRAFR